jgi:hypothetical protein
VDAYFDVHRFDWGLMEPYWDHRAARFAHKLDVYRIDFPGYSIDSTVNSKEWFLWGLTFSMTIELMGRGGIRKPGKLENLWRTNSLIFDCLGHTMMILRDSDSVLVKYHFEIFLTFSSLVAYYLGQRLWRSKL